jgi:hypothetical protein
MLRSAKRSKAVRCQAKGVSILCLARRNPGSAKQHFVLHRARGTKRLIAQNLLRLAERLEPVAVGIDDEGGVVIGTVILAQARFAVVAPAGLERRRVERVDRLGVGRLEAEMQA